MSKLYNYFELPKNIERNYQAKCKICSRLISAPGKTCSNLTTHLKVGEIFQIEIYTVMVQLIYTFNYINRGNILLST